MELCAEYSDDIPNLSDREDRYTEIMVDCHNMQQYWVTIASGGLAVCMTMNGKCLFR